MSESEFEALTESYVAGGMGRRRFVGKMLAAGMTAIAAAAFADSLVAQAGAVRTVGKDLNIYGPPGLLEVYGSGFTRTAVPGQGGAKPGKGDAPPPGNKPPF
jgi:hypothetical protein